MPGLTPETSDEVADEVELLGVHVPWSMRSRSSCSTVRQDHAAFQPLPLRRRRIAPAPRLKGHVTAGRGERPDQRMRQARMIMRAIIAYMDSLFLMPSHEAHLQLPKLALQVQAVPVRELRCQLPPSATQGRYTHMMLRISFA